MTASVVSRNDGVYSFVIISIKISNGKIQLSTGGWGPIQYKIDSVHFVDIE
jgi:hypothetical protein